MADTIVFEQSPAYTVLEFRNKSPEPTEDGAPAAGRPDQAAINGDRGQRLVHALEEAGVIHKIDNETLLDVAPATRYARGAVKLGGYAAEPAG